VVVAGGEVFEVDEGFAAPPGNPKLLPPVTIDPPQTFPIAVVALRSWEPDTDEPLAIFRSAVASARTAWDAPYAAARLARFDASVKMALSAPELEALNSLLRVSNDPHSAERVVGVDGVDDEHPDTPRAVPATRTAPIAIDLNPTTRYRQDGPLTNGFDQFNATIHTPYLLVFDINK
jgi:hypothetical protein